jgi:thymidylate kinase
MNTLIFEGIATSGKSTLIRQLNKNLKNTIDICILDESTTHHPIMQQPRELHVNFFEKLVHENLTLQPDLLLIDRLYITQAYRARASTRAYISIEKLLKPYNPQTILLTIDEEAVENRIKKAAKHRDPEWRDYLKTKGNTFQEIAQRYTEQQRGIITLAKQSSLPYTIFDATNHNYESICLRIANILKNQNTEPDT